MVRFEYFRQVTSKGPRGPNPRQPLGYQTSAAKWQFSGKKESAGRCGSSYRISLGRGLCSAGLLARHLQLTPRHAQPKRRCYIATIEVRFFWRNLVGA
jgi:hypothetical protein